VGAARRARASNKHIAGGAGRALGLSAINEASRAVAGHAVARDDECLRSVLESNALTGNWSITRNRNCTSSRGTDTSTKKTAAEGEAKSIKVSLRSTGTAGIITAAIASLSERGSAIDASSVNKVLVTRCALCLVALLATLSKDRFAALAIAINVGIAGGATIFSASIAAALAAIAKHGIALNSL